MTRCLLLLAAVSLLTGMSVGGCAGIASPDAPDTAPTAAGDGGLLVVDALGRSVEFPQPPQRIVVAGRATLMVVNAIYLFPEASERVVGVTSGSQKPGRFLSLVDPSFGEKTLLAQDAGPEQIAPLKPDVVVLRSFLAGDLGDALGKLGIPVIYLDPETPENYFRDIAILGRLLGSEARAEEIQSFYQSRLDAISLTLQGVSSQQKPSLLLLQHSDKGGEVAFKVPPASWIQTAEAELAGGVPVWKDEVQGGGWTIVSFEQIAAWDPDSIFIISYGSDAAVVVDRLREDQKWQALKAVQDGRIHGFAGDIYSWDQPDPRWILGVTWLAGRIYPSRFPDLDIQQHVIQFFEEMYGMDASAIQDLILPSIQGDVR